ncbi:hypothetical protein EXIGLDRAFT_198426 [Exidia glandulosa HHB12029]|uniref:Uncharacterized protein n=1 Tax=Exidia glandulosa HHB12029 TaxID=1314781 RepID=A0A165MXA0_EXIGL|nr:hypothetical protein EXIGLDRAFT_198426 [Exidia glandulosa HHB12029]
MHEIPRRARVFYFPMCMTSRSWHVVRRVLGQAARHQERDAAAPRTHDNGAIRRYPKASRLHRRCAIEVRTSLLLRLSGRYASILDTYISCTHDRIYCSSSPPLVTYAFVRVDESTGLFFPSFHVSLSSSCLTRRRQLLPSPVHRDPSSLPSHTYRVPPSKIEPVLRGRKSYARTVRGGLTCRHR